MQESGTEALVLLPGPTLQHLARLSFHLLERPVIGIFRNDGRSALVLPELEASKAEAAASIDTLFPYGEDERSRSDALERAVRELGLGGLTIGVEPLRMRFMELRLLQQAAPRASFVAAEKLTTSLRLRKSKDEVDAMRRAVAIAEMALQATLPLLRIGMSEREVASELTLQLLRAGNDPEAAFSPIIASGPNSALPHAVPGDRRLAAGDMLIIDWGARAGGYVSDLTRTFVIREADAELARIHDVVCRANAEARQVVRPGQTCSAIDQAARRVIAQSGYGEYFIHRTGHGIGLEEHEPPYIREGNEEPLEAGMTFTIEPGVYLVGRGGVRIEDNIVVTEKGGETLSTFPRELKVIP
jgi:Xaa-Pro dipeptidase